MSARTPTRKKFLPLRANIDRTELLIDDQWCLGMGLAFAEIADVLSMLATSLRCGSATQALNTLVSRRGEVASDDAASSQPTSAARGRASIEFLEVFSGTSPIAKIMYFASEAHVGSRAYAERKKVLADAAAFTFATLEQRQAASTGASPTALSEVEVIRELLTALTDHYRRECASFVDDMPTTPRGRSPKPRQSVSPLARSARFKEQLSPELTWLIAQFAELRAAQKSDIATYRAIAKARLRAGSSTVVVEREAERLRKLMSRHGMRKPSRRP